MTLGAAARELIDYAIMTEFIAIKSQTDELSDYRRARFLILECIIKCALKDRDRGDYIDDEITRKLREAGELLNSEDGMHDPLVWSFIPRRYYGMIDHAWDGIGSWRA